MSFQLFVSMPLSQQKKESKKSGNTVEVVLSQCRSRSKRKNQYTNAPKPDGKESQCRSRSKRKNRELRNIPTWRLWCLNAALAAKERITFDFDDVENDPVSMPLSQQKKESKKREPIVFIRLSQCRSRSKRKNQPHS